MSPILTGVIASGISGHLTPPWSPEGAYDSLATVTVPSGGVASVTFAGIPSGYKHLQLRFSATTGADANIRHYVNGDTSANKALHELTGSGSAASAYASTGESQPALAVGQSTYPIVAITDFLDYTNTNKNKVWRTLWGTDSNGANINRIQLKSILWNNTNAITSITLVAESTTFQQYSSFALYGVK